FPLFEKIEVNVENRHPIYAELTQVADADGNAGDIGWNFEKFLLAPGGKVVGRYRTGVEPEDPHVVAAVEAHVRRGRRELPCDAGSAGHLLPAGALVLRFAAPGLRIFGDEAGSMTGDGTSERGLQPPRMLFSLGREGSKRRRGGTDVAE